MCILMFTTPVRGHWTNDTMPEGGWVWTGRAEGHSVLTTLGVVQSFEAPSDGSGRQGLAAEPKLLLLRTARKTRREF